MKRTSLKALATIVAGAAIFAGGRSILAQTVGNSVAQSVHNLNNVYGYNTIKDNYGQNQVCLPCHSPHQQPAANVAANVADLWNHTLNPASNYTLFGSGSSYLTTIDDVSRICLGCHDGTIAVDSYGSNPTNPSVTGTMASNPATAGFVIGAGGNLTHDHPIDVLYNSASSYTGVSTQSTAGTFTYTTTWNSNNSNNDPSTFTYNGYTSLKWGAKTYSTPGLSAVSFYTPSGSTQSVSVVDTNPTGGTQIGSTGNYTHTISVSSKYVYCRSCHDPHNNYFHFMRIPNDNSQVCLTCHNK